MADTRTMPTAASASWIIHVAIITVFCVCVCHGDICRTPRLQEKNCSCTYNSDDELITLECLQAGTSDIFDYIGSTVEKITFRNEPWEVLPYGRGADRRCLAKDTVFNKLTFLDLSGNHIREIGDHAFECFPNLETLVLDDNEWLVAGEDSDQKWYNSTALKDLHFLKQLYLRKAFTDRAYSSGSKTGGVKQISYYPTPDAVLDGNNLLTLELLDLSDNHMLGFSPDVFCNLTSLRVLRLSSNYLGNPLMWGNNHYDHAMSDENGNHGNCASSLKELHLDNNLISFLSKNFTIELGTMNLEVLNITGNRFRCDCDMLEFHAWLKTAGPYVIDKEELTCADPQNMYGKIILDLSPEELVCPSSPGVDKSMKAAYVVLCLLMVAIAVAVVVAVFCNRQLIKKKCLRILTPLRGSPKYEPYPYSSMQI